jgi:segregation and condensation protein B
METNDAKKIIEALLFVAELPVTLKMLDGVFDKTFSKDDIRGMIESLAQDYRDRETSLEVKEIAGGWQLATKPELAPWIRKLFKDRLSYRLSPSAMETLSIIAYKQPITRGEIEEIRGVEVSAVVDTLMDRKLVRIVGRKETLGRPILFGSTPEFLRVFGLKRLEDLPPVDTLLPPADFEAQIETAGLPTETGVVMEEPLLDETGSVLEDPTTAETVEAVVDETQTELVMGEAVEGQETL